MANKKYTLEEGTTAVYTATLRDADGNPIPLASMQQLTITLFDRNTSIQINDRANQNAKNMNNVTYSVDSGQLNWDIQIADTPVLNPDIQGWRPELHVARFDFYYGSGKHDYHEIQMEVSRKQVSIPPPTP